jgi:NitT/TauT family transport system permease protein
VLTKVIIPLAMPNIVNSLRLLLGLAFGYIILAEMVDMDTGVGKLIMMSQRRGPKEHVYLILLFITLMAFLMDRMIYGLQRYFFPYKFTRK